MSATPRTVTVCAAFQLLSVKTSDESLTSSASVESDTETVIVTLSAVEVSLSPGCEERRTVKVEVIPFSSVSFDASET